MYFSGKRFWVRLKQGFQEAGGTCGPNVGRKVGTCQVEKSIVEDKFCIRANSCLHACAAECCR